MKQFDQVIQDEDLKESKTKSAFLNNPKLQPSFGAGKMDPEILEYKRLVNKLLLDEEKVEKMEDARESKFYFEKMRCLELCRLMLMVMAQSIAILDYEIEFKGVNDYYAQWFLYIILICSVMLITMTYFSYLAKNQFIIATKVVGSNASIFNTGQWKNMIIEMSVYMVFPMPWFQDIKIHFFIEFYQIEVFHYLNEILLLVMMIRFLLMIKILLTNTKWYTERVNRICNLYATKMSALFIVKVNMMINPMRVFWFIYVVSLFMLSYAVRICERPLIRDEANKGTVFDFNYYPTAIWMMLISIPSVGYGDKYPVTVHGRLIAAVSFISGTFMLSLLCEALLRSIKISALEEKSIQILTKLNTRAAIKRVAIRMFGCIAKITYRKRKGLEKNIFLSRTLRHSAVLFKSLNRYYKSQAEQQNLMEQIDKQFSYVRDETHTLLEDLITEEELSKKVLNQVILQTSSVDPNSLKFGEQAKNVNSNFDLRDLSSEKNFILKRRQLVPSMQDFNDDMDAAAIRQKPYNFSYNMVNHVHPNQFY